jgi:hypothetical protein
MLQSETFALPLNVTRSLQAEHNEEQITREASLGQLGHGRPLRPDCHCAG